MTNLPPQTNARLRNCPPLGHAPRPLMKHYFPPRGPAGPRRWEINLSGARRTVARENRKSRRGMSLIQRFAGAVNRAFSRCPTTMGLLEDSSISQGERWIITMLQ
ncbi:hypothetical protein CEXT_258051 [Caerostris extrusa]|uniref:Uncharacterized protein n=1 Tax=Caerostris extrusa TaxID=172846 RepID=A0AAV4NK22_CAEEX|nr:hypothetical protein CEXT_258051 [Caerostris extrusa]